MTDYSKEDELQELCNHEIWITICVYCGKILADGDSFMTISTFASNSREYRVDADWSERLW